MLCDVGGAVILISVGRSVCCGVSAGKRLAKRLTDELEVTGTARAFN